MWHSVTVVADLNKIPAADLVDFAISRDEKYSIYFGYGTVMVNTFNVDKLVEDFKHFAYEQELYEQELK